MHTLNSLRHVAAIAFALGVFIVPGVSLADTDPLPPTEGQELLTDNPAVEPDTGDASVRVFYSTCWPSSDKTPLQWYVNEDPGYAGHFDYVDEADGNAHTDLVYRGAGGQWMADTYGVSGTVGDQRCGWARWRANGPGAADYEILYEDSSGQWHSLGVFMVTAQSSFGYLWGPYKSVPSCISLQHRIIRQRPGITMQVDEVHIGYWQWE